MKNFIAPKRSRRYIEVHKCSKEMPTKFGYYVVYDGKESMVAIWNKNVGFYTRKDYHVTLIPNVKKWFILPNMEI